MPPPDPAWFEHPSAVSGSPSSHRPARTRCTPGSTLAARTHHDAGLADSPDGFMTGGSLAQWFDVIVHRQEVSPAAPLCISAPKVPRILGGVRICCAHAGPMSRSPVPAMSMGPTRREVLRMMAGSATVAWAPRRWPRGATSTSAADRDESRHPRWMACSASMKRRAPRCRRLRPHRAQDPERRAAARIPTRCGNLVEWANRRGQQVAPQGQSHSVYGRAQVADGIVIDMSLLRRVHDVEADRVVVDAGAT